MAHLDASELYNAIDKTIANVINCELMRAKETFGVFPAIKTLKVFDGDDPKDWAEYDPADQSLSIRAVHPKSGEKMTARTWNNMIQKSWSDGGCSTNDWRHAFWHEIGHAYETFVKRNYPDAFDLRFAWIFDIWNTSKISIYSRLSSLAVDDPRQLIAEAFCVVFSGDKTNKLANEIVDMILTGGKKCASSRLIPH